MKILVLGKHGQLARSLAELSSAKNEIICLSRYEADISSRELLGSKVKKYQPEIVINTAAFTAVNAAEQSPKQSFLLNETGARNIAEICSDLDIPLIHISTDYVFDGQLTRSYRPDDSTSPINIYGKSKLAGEVAVREQHPEHIILRTSWIFSPFGKNFMITMLALAKEKSSIHVVSDQFGRPTYAPHLASALIQLSEILLNRNNGWGTYHLTNSGESISWFDFATEIFLQSATSESQLKIRPISVDQFPTSAKRPENSRLDTTLFTDKFGVTLPDWKTGIADCLATFDKADYEEKKLGDKT